MLTSQAVGTAFGRAASTYDDHAELQHEAGLALLQRVPADLPAGAAVDLGAGTAPFARALRSHWPDRRWLALDIAEPMLHEAAARERLGSDFAPVAADLQALPLAAGQLALVYSSFALQWSPNPSVVLQALARTLAPGGILAVGLPVAGSLAELQASWAEVDAEAHVNALTGSAQWWQALQATGLTVLSWQEQALYRYHDDVQAIARMLKNTGAHQVDRPGATGLTGRRRYRALVQAYERRRTALGLPLTWQVLYMVARK